MSDIGSTTLEKDSEDRLEKSTGTGSEILEDDVLDQKVWSKLDRHILPLIAMFYLLSFLVTFQIHFHPLPRTDSAL